MQNLANQKYESNSEIISAPGDAEESASQE